jgi:hypothetical protein
MILLSFADAFQRRKGVLALPKILFWKGRNENSHGGIPRLFGL